MGVELRIPPLRILKSLILVLDVAAGLSKAVVQLSRNLIMLRLRAAWLDGLARG